MDNRTIDFTSVGVDALSSALALMWPSAPGGKATHYCDLRLEQVTKRVQHADGGCSCWPELKESAQGVPTLVLLWHEDHGSRKLRSPLGAREAAEYAKRWLDKVNYGPEPDIDGSCEKGFRVFTEAWGHVAGRHYCIVAVQPAWAMYGK